MLLSLGNIGDKVRRIVMTVQKPVRSAFNFLVDKAVRAGRGLRSLLASSRLGRGAGRVRDKATAAYAKGKAVATATYAKTKARVTDTVAKGKAYAAAKARAVGEKLGLLEKPFAMAGAQHTLAAKPGSAAITMSSPNPGPLLAKIDEHRRVLVAAHPQPDAHVLEQLAASTASPWSLGASSEWPA